MLTREQVSWKNDNNAIAWCNLKGFRYLNHGAWDVFYVTPEQEGTKMQGLAGEMDAHSSINWLVLFGQLDDAGIEKVNS